MIETLISVVRAAVHTVYGFDPGPRAAIDLESSTEKKFSRHLIFTDVVFADNREMGELRRQESGWWHAVARCKMDWIGLVEVMRDTHTMSILIPWWQQNRSPPSKCHLGCTERDE